MIKTITNSTNAGEDISGPHCNIHCYTFAISTLFFFSFITVQAQSNIHGKVVDSTGKPIQYANVLLLNYKDSSLVKGMLTNEKGQFSFEQITTGKYYISSTQTGTNPVFSKPVDIGSNAVTIDLGQITLHEKAITLADVTVTAKKPLYEQKIDRLVINVAGSITSAGSTALDILVRSPGVMVNRLSNSLSVNGKNGVIVMINGKRNYMDMASVIQMLEAMPSGNIERIEIITTPPASFDAEGSAGIINIVLKQNNQFGTNGSYALTAAYDKGEQNSISLQINHRKGKLNVFGNYFFLRTRVTQLWTIYHAVTTAGNFLENDAVNNRHAVSWLHDGSAGLDYELSKKTIIGALFTGSYRHWSMQSDNSAIVSMNHHTDTSIEIMNHELHTTGSYSFNINMQHTFKPDEKLTVNLDYLNYNDHNPTTYHNTYYNASHLFIYSQDVKSGKITPLNFQIAAIDYTKKLSKKTDLEAGAKATVSHLNNDVQVAALSQNNWVQDNALSGNQTLDEKILAAYSSFNIAFNQKTSLKGGFRYEYTSSNLGSQTQANVVDRHYGNFFPSVFVLHKFNDSMSVNLSYSKRIWRPSFADLAPWVLFYDPNTFQTGNPGLRPSITDAVNTSFTFKNKIVSLSYSYTAHPIMIQPKLDDGTNKLITSYGNGKNYQNIMLGFSLPFKLTKWWNTQNDISGYFTQTNSFYKAAVHTETKGFFANSTQTFTLPKEISLELSANYYSGGAWGLYHFNSQGSLDFGARKKFTKKNYTLSFNIRNLLNSEVNRYAAIIPEQNLLQRNKQIYSYTNFSLSLTHNFGNEKVKGKRDRSTGAEDEKGRAY